MGNQKVKPIIFKLGNEKLESTANSIHEITVLDSNGSSIQLGEFLDGKKCVIVVNVASKCPLTEK
jgi:hypothetical protein